MLARTREPPPYYPLTRSNLAHGFPSPTSFSLCLFLPNSVCPLLVPLLSSLRMASEDGRINASAYNEEDLDDDEEPLNDVILDEEDDDDEEELPAAADADSSESDTISTSSAPAISAVPISSSVPNPTSTAPSAVNVAILPPSSSSHVPNGSDPSLPLTSIATPATAIAALTAVTTATPALVERRPIDDSRRLFQRLWTDEDEIELLRGFLEYTSQRGPNWTGHHHDTTAFYDQIKSKLQLDCNKNQLVEKLRRLKKKYRKVVARIRSGKDFVFKSPHDQATFEISSKIWSNSTIHRPEFDDEEQNPNPNNSTPLGFNLNSAGDHRNSTSTSYSIDINSSDKTAITTVNMGTPNNRSRKRTRVKVEEKGGVGGLRNVSFGGNDVPAPANPPVQSSVEGTVKSCLPSLLEEFINDAIGRRGWEAARPGEGATNGIGSLALNAVPMNFSAVSLGRKSGEGMDERWRKQQIMELEVYSKRLELVQDQIKVTLEELRSTGN